SVAFAPGPLVITGSADATLKLWRVRDGREMRSLSGHRGMVNAVAVSPKDGTIASGSRTGEVFLWETGTGRMLKALETQPNIVGTLIFSADSNKLLTTAAEGSDNFVQRVWDVETGRVLAEYRGHDDIVLAAAISPDQRVAVTGGGKNHELHVWDITTGAPV